MGEIKKPMWYFYMDILVNNQPNIKETYDRYRQNAPALTPSGSQYVRFIDRYGTFI